MEGPRKSGGLRFLAPLYLEDDVDKIRHAHANIAPAIGNYSRSIRTGDMLFISGCTAVGTEAEDKGVMRQADQTIDRIKRIVEAEGGTTSDIVKLVIFVTDMPEFRTHLAEFDDLLERYFQGVYPASTLVASPGLARPTLKIEVEATAVF